LPRERVMQPLPRLSEPGEAQPDEDTDENQTAWRERHNTRHMQRHSA
jgi:hypothetical protein